MEALGSALRLEGSRRLDDEPPAPQLGMIGGSEAMRRLRRVLARVATAARPVLLLGESGTGKELAARAVHDESGRRGPFVAVNCGALPRDLVESELFGHERGAFTGATQRRPGCFQEADGGTLFLDEIGELPVGLQPRLLRVLETGVVRAVGASGERRVDARVVAATHQDVRRAVAEGRFRLDLYHRLAALEVRLPPLRERPEDLPLLARHFLDEAVAGAAPRTLSPAALDALARHDWPGNVRELRNVIARAVVFGGEVLEPADLWLPADGPLVAAERAAPSLLSLAPGDATLSVPYPIEEPPLRRIERTLIAQALERSGGNRRAAAASLGMPKSTFCDKVRRYGLAPPVRRAPSD